MFPRVLHICRLKVVHGELQLIGQPHIAILHFVSRLRIARPHNVVDRIHILQKRADTLQAIRQLDRNREQVHAAALLEIGKLRDLQSIEHHLPAHAPRAQCRSFPVIFFELDIVLAEVDSNRA